MRAADFVKQGLSIAAIKSRGECGALKALQRYLHIQEDHLGRKFLFYLGNCINSIIFSVLKILLAISIISCLVL